MTDKFELIPAPAFSSISSSEKKWPEHIWTGGELRQQFPEATVLSELIKGVTGHIENLGEVVCEFCINGITLSEAEELRFSKTPADEIQTLCVRSEKPLKLLDDSIAGCTQYIDKIMETLEKASTLFRAGDIKGAHERHHKCIEAAEVFVEMITHYKIAYQTLKGGLPESWGKLEKEMLSSLSQILSEFEKKNYILVADLLEYDLSNIFNAWKQELEKLERHGIGDSA